MHFPLSSERQQMISEAITEAKAHTASRDQRNQAVVQEKKAMKQTSDDIMKLFKKASKKAIKIGTAQLEFEDMVRRAERKLSEKERLSLVSTQNSKEMAATIARELFHIPGSMLTKQEIARMWQETCQDALMEANCYIPTIFQFRTPDGTCNNLDKPLQGAAGTSFRRLIPGQYEDGCSTLRGNLQNRFADVIAASAFEPPNPSARFISSTIIEDRQPEETPFTHILMQWGQFLDHDLDLSPELEEECISCEFTEICQPIRVFDNDIAFGIGTPNNGDCLPLRRSLPTCPTDKPGSFSPREQINDITSYIDGSMVYGSSEELSLALRELEGGLLRTGPNFPANQPSLPQIDEETKEFIACPNRKDCFLCGDARCNEQISLSIMHTIWLREHNRCAREMARINPQFNDERLYQECRRIVGALIQKITYKDYLPKVFGPENFDIFVGPYPGYNDNVDASVPNSFATAAYRYGHSLIRPFFDRLNGNFAPLPIGPLNLVNAFFNPPQFNASLGTDPIVRGLISVNALRVDEFMNNVLTTQLFQTPASPGFDLASLNIQRGRDHGLPPYLTWRNFCTKVFDITSPFENLMTKLNFLNIYGSLDTVDLWIGGLAEERLPESLLGATFACLFGLTFANVRDGDRFYYERPGIFTPAQLNSIEQDSLSRVLCDNLDNLQMVQPDAFLSNQTRIRCDNIPRLDLTLFREEPCFFRVRMAPRSFRAVVDTLARSRRSLRAAFSTLSFPPSSQPEFQCQQIECPPRDDPLEVITYSNYDMLSSTSVSSNSALPPSSYTGAYIAEWDRPTFDRNQGGVFTSRGACEGSTGSALDFSFSQKAATTQGADMAHDEIPHELLHFIKDKKPVKASSRAEVKQEKEVKVMSDDALMQELEDALKVMHQ